jgi:transposase-like protein
MVKRYSEEVINDAIALYESGESIAEINRTFELEKTTIYHFLKARGIPTKSKVNGMKRQERSLDLVVTTDKEGFVIGAENRAAHKLPVFEIKFTGTLEVEATTLEDAIAIARKRMIVERIYSVREK